MDVNVWLVQVLACVQAALGAAAVALTPLKEDDENEIPTPVRERVHRTAGRLVVLGSLKWRLDKEDREDNGGIHEKQRRTFDCERAQLCFHEDCLGPEPQFEHCFARVSRVARGIAEKLTQIAGNADPFFAQRNLVTGEPGTCPEAEVLMGLEMSPVGVSSTAFMDCFQVGPATGKSCMKKLAQAIVSSGESREKCGRDVNAEDGNDE